MPGTELAFSFHDADGAKRRSKSLNFSRTSESFEVVITGRCQENERQLHPYLELGEDGNDTILDRVPVRSYTTMMFHKNNPLVDGLTLDAALPALLAHVSSVLMVNIINEVRPFSRSTP
jgi:hypothetical protein